ncbi:MAG: Tc toxin subunit A, partial [Spirochaetaceae bacterium]|nr:Tc toxin subunit A [Spirochaetaceae bacterium]
MNILGEILAGETGLNPVGMVVRATWYNATGPTLGEATVGSDRTFDLELTASVSPDFDDSAHLDREVLITLFDGSDARRIGPYVLSLEEISELTGSVIFRMVDEHAMLAVGTFGVGSTGVVVADKVVRAHWSGTNGALLGEAVVEADGGFALELQAPESEEGLDQQPGRQVLLTLWDGGATLSIDPTVYSLGSFVRRLTINVKSAVRTASPRVHGRLTTKADEPLASYDVQVIAVGFKSKVAIAHAKSDTAGLYDIPYVPKSTGLDLQVLAMMETSGGDQVMAQSQTFYGVRGDLKADLVAAEDVFKVQMPSDAIEWSWVDELLSGLAAGSSEEINAEDVTYLAKSTGISEDLVKLWFECRGDAGAGGGDINIMEDWVARYSAMAVGGLGGGGEPLGPTETGLIDTWMGLGPTDASLLQTNSGDGPLFYLPEDGPPCVQFSAGQIMESAATLPVDDHERTIVLIGAGWSSAGNQKFLRYGAPDTANEGFIIGTLASGTAAWLDRSSGVEDAGAQAFGEGPLGATTQVLAVSFTNDPPEVHLRASYTGGAVSDYSYDLDTGAGALVVGATGTAFSVYEIIVYDRAITPEEWGQIVEAAEFYETSSGGDPVLTPEVIWGLSRQGMPADPAATAAIPESRIAEMLTAAVEANQIHEDAYTSAAAVYAAIKQRVAGEIVSKLAEEDPEEPLTPSVASESAKKVADLLTEEGQKEKFVGYMLGSKAPEAFEAGDWDALADALEVATDSVLMGKLKRRVDLSKLGKGSSGFAKAVETAHTDKETRAALAGLDVGAWIAVANEVAEDDLPEGLEEKTLTEKRKELARFVVRKLSAEYPAEAFAGRFAGEAGVDGRAAVVMTAIATDGKALREEPIDFASYVADLPDAGADAEADALLIEQMKGYQSLSRAVDDVDHVILLYKAGYTSQGKIEATAPAKLVEDVKAAAATTESPPSDAELERLSRHVYTQSRGSLLQRAIVRSYGKYTAADTEGEAPIDPNAFVPNWRNLFGSPDSCECDQCLSVFSPAAYLVNTLQYLDQATQGDGQDAFFDRRPDLLNLDLTCENTYTQVPYIDLANEILEYKVHPDAAP